MMFVLKGHVRNQKSMSIKKDIFGRSLNVMNSIPKESNYFSSTYGYGKTEYFMNCSHVIIYSLPRTTSIYRSQICTAEMYALHI